MTAPSTINMELFLGGTWVDIASAAQGRKVRLPAGITVTRGRNNEASDPDPGTMTFTVDNADGRFTIGNTGGVYGANFKRWVPVRYTVNSSRRFTGYVQSAPTTWNRETRSLSDVTITCIDVIGLMAMSPTVSSWATSLIDALSPFAWWPFNDAEYSTSVDSPIGSVPLVLSTIGLGVVEKSDIFAFGVEGPPGLESDTQMQITSRWGDDATSMYLTGSGVISVPHPISTPSTTYTALLLYTPTGSAPNPETILDVNLDTASTQFRAMRVGLDLAFSPDLTTITARAAGIFRVGVPILLGIVVTPTSMTLLNVPSVSVSWTPSVTLPEMFVQVGWADGAYAHLALVNGAMAAADFSRLQLLITGLGSGSVVDWLNRVSSEAGYALSSAATFNRTMERPQLKDSNPAEIGNALAKSAGALFVADRLGVPKWLDFSYCPTRVDLDAGGFNNALTWDADQSLYYTDVQVDGIQRATVAGFPRSAVDIPGLLPSADEAHFVTWLANTADIWGGPRLSGITVNLYPMDSTKTAAYLGLDLKSRAFPLNTPPQLPTPMVVTVEGYTETVTDSAWMLSFNTAPDPRFVLGDTVSGVLASNYRVCPMG